MERERAYLDELTFRLRKIFEEELVGVYAGGSHALGGYVPERSDLDVAAIVRHRLQDGVADRIVQAVRHESLPCPARKLELVVYTADAGEPFRADTEPQAGEEHWFAIGRGVLAAHGVPLSGPPPDEVFVAPRRADLLPILAEVLRWYLRVEGGSEDGLLNAGRSLRLARDGVWTPKPEMRSWAAEALAEAGTIDEVLRRVIAELEGA